MIEVDRHRKRVVVSQKKAVEDEKKVRREVTVSSLEEGQIRRGVVRRVTDYGAFVDLGGIDGLLHVTEMSWGRVNHPADIVKPGANDRRDGVEIRCGQRKDLARVGQADPSGSLAAYRSILCGRR